MNAVDFIYCECDDACFWLSARDCHVPTPASQNLEVGQQIWIFGITKSRIANVSILELVHRE